jgi:hypothetical protein
MVLTFVMLSVEIHQALVLTLGSVKDVSDAITLQEGHIGGRSLVPDEQVGDHFVTVHAPGRSISCTK